MPYSLFLKKQNFKFSSSHFTIFSKNTAEALHGHNYQVALRVEFSDINKDTAIAVDFNIIKKAVRALCEELDEKILIPCTSPYLTTSDSPHYKNHYELQFHNRHYCFPKNEVVQIEASNITSESLAYYFYKKLEKSLSPNKFSVTIFETPGQAATYFV